MIKKKGQIVPKYLVKAVEKKSQHLVKFGCDVEIEGRTLTALDGGTAIIIPEVKYCNMKKNKRLVKGFDICIETYVGFDICIRIEGQPMTYTINYIYVKGLLPFFDAPEFLH